MADPRFYRNCGPFELAVICAKAGIALPSNADGAAPVWDLARLDGAAPGHLSFFSGGREMRETFFRSHAGFCLVPADGSNLKAPDGMMLLACASVPRAFCDIATLFYPDASLEPVMAGVDPTAKLGEDVVLGPGVIVGAGAEIGDRSRIGGDSVIGPGVAIGHDCEIGGAACIGHTYIGDHVVIQPGAQIGQRGSPTKQIWQLGRVIIQDKVEIGGACVIDRGGLGDTVIGEGTKIDNLVRVGPNAQIGRYCVVAAPVAESSVIADFAVLGTEDSGSIPAKPIREGIGGVAP